MAEGRPPGWPQNIYIGGEVWDIDDAIAAGLLALPEGESRGVGVDVVKPKQTQTTTLARSPEAQKILDLLAPQDPEGTMRGGLLPFRQNQSEEAYDPQADLANPFRQVIPGFPGAPQLPSGLEWAMPEFLRDTVRGAVRGWDQLGIAGRRAVGAETPEGPVGLPMDLPVAMLDLMGGGSRGGAENALGMFIGPRGMLPKDRQAMGRAMHQESTGTHPEDIWFRERMAREPFTGSWYTEIPDTRLGVRTDEMRSVGDSYAIPRFQARAPKEPLMPAREPLGSYFSHPEFFHRYPKIEDYETTPMPLGSIGVSGSYSPDELRFRFATGSPEQMRETGVHEMQHSVQHAEGWPGGTSPSAFLPEGHDHEYEMVKNIYDGLTQEVMRGGEINHYRVRDALRDLATKGTTSRSRKESLEAAAQHPKWADWLNTAEILEELEARAKEARRSYNADAGEAMSRNTEYRMLNPESYREATPWDTLGFMRDPVKPEGTHASESIRPRPEWSEAQASTQRVTDTPEFRNWFGDSKIVDDAGEPLVVYHGTRNTEGPEELGQGIDQFDTRRKGEVDGGWYGRGTYFSPDSEVANQYATLFGHANAAVYPVYLSLQNPYRVTQGMEPGFQTLRHSFRRDFGDNAYAEVVSRGNPGDNEFIRFNENVNDWLKEQEYDGVVAHSHSRDAAGNHPINEIVAFEPTQIKSATGNSGAFDPNNPSILSANPRTSAPAALHAAGKSAGRDATPIPEWFDNYSDLPDEVAWAFNRVGDAQRGAPEQAMLSAQRAVGGGVLNPVIEHVGDLTHRMTHHIGYNATYPDLVREKTQRGLYYLKHPYGFEREMRQNLENNAAVNGVSVEAMEQQMDTALARYAQEHEKLPVYNRPQWLAREAAVSVGRKDWDRAGDLLRELDELAKSDSWEFQAQSYNLNASGQLEEYTP